MTSEKASATNTGGLSHSPREQMPAGLRITSWGGKVAFFTIGYFVALCAGILCWDLFHFTVGSMVYLALFLVWAGVAARSFRGPDEPKAAARPLWRLTARPMAGWVLAGSLLLQVADLVASPLGIREAGRSS